MCPQAAIPGCPLSRRYLGVKQTLSKPTGLTVLDCCEDAVGRLLNALSWLASQDVVEIERSAGYAERLITRSIDRAGRE
jgi:hypothetical protein